MNAGELCTREVVVAERELSVIEAAERMASHHVGDLVIAEERGTELVPIGIVTDRDLVRFALAHGLDVIRRTRVVDAMSGELVTARETDDVASVLKLMRGHGVRRMPIVNARGALVGILTADDVLEWLSEQMDDLVKLIAREQKREARGA